MKMPKDLSAENQEKTLGINMENRKMLIGLILLLTLLNLGAYVPVSMSQPQYGGTLVVAGYNNPDRRMNPNLGQASYANIPGNPCFNALVTRDFEGNFKPDLAESWETSADGKAWTFHLADNVYWHDGVKCTSADVKFAVEEVIMQYHEQKDTYVDIIDSIETPDDYTVVFHLKNAQPWFLDKCDRMIMTISSPKHLYEGTDILENPHNFAPIGTGPFEFAELVRDQYIRLVKNENYWKSGLPYLDEWILKIIPDYTLWIPSLINGEVNYANAYVPYSALTYLEASPDLYNVTYYTYLTPNLQVVNLNVRRAPMNNVLVRQAMAHALDMEFIIKAAQYGAGEPCVGPIGPESKWYNDDLEPYEYNPDLAEQLLDDAGYSRGSDGTRFTLELVHLSQFDDAKCAEAIVAMFGEVGIKVTDVTMESTAIIEKCSHPNHDFDMVLSRPKYGPDPSTIDLWLHSSQYFTYGHQTNYGGYNNSRVDELLGLGLLELDESKRKEYYDEIQELFAEDVPAIVLHTRPRFAVTYIPQGVKGLPEGRLLGRASYENVYFQLQTSEEETLFTLPVVIAIVVAVVAVVVIVGAIYLLRRRRTGH